MIGQIVKIHSDFYYVQVCEQEQEGSFVIECKLRETLKKQKASIFTGDFVEVSNGAIEKILPRKNSIPRPSVANLDLLIVVSSIREPALDFIQLNRYLTFAKYHKIPAALCFNKEDLKHEGDLEKNIVNIYKPLGYEIIFTSALKKTGLKSLTKLAKDKTVAFCGNSGVGKSSLLNALNPNFNLRTKQVSQKTDRGVHTTRHIEILDFGDFKIIDTPGFSQLRFDFILPNELVSLFEDISQYTHLCKFRDCTHQSDASTLSFSEADYSQPMQNCGVIKNLHKIAQSRYESYLEFLQEAKEYKEKITYQGKKVETTSKTMGSKTAPKISERKRALSRKTLNQNIDLTLDSFNN